MGRRYDPERRQRIIDAAIRVVAERGIRGLSHRAVAAEADVPLGSTTYHFSTLDDLLVAALRQCNDTYMGEIEERAFLGAETGLPDGLARLIEEMITKERARAELEYELYLAALRRPAVRPIAAEWIDHVTALLARRTDPATARALAALADGLALQALLTGGEFDRGHAEEMFARLISTG